MIWLLFGILCAIIYTAEHIFSKRLVDQVDPYYAAYLINLVAAVLTFPFVIIFWDILNITPRALVAMALLSVIIVFTQFLYLKSMKTGSLSKTIPLLCLTPMFTVFSAFFLIGEMPGPLGFLGIMVIVAGTYLLNIKQRSRKGFFAPFCSIIEEKGSRYMLIVAVIYGFTSSMNKYVIINSSIWFQLMCGFYFLILLQTIFFLIKDKGRFPANVKNAASVGLHKFVFIVFIQYGVLTFQFIGLSLTYTAYIIALKRTTAIFSVLAGYFFWDEKKDFRTNFIGAAMLVIGVALLVL